MRSDSRRTRDRPDTMATYILLIFVPISLGLDHFGANPILVFLTAALAVVPLTVLIADATENLSLRLGPTLGGLLNGTMGNVPEMIIAISALRKGLEPMVKASLTGTLLSNILLVLGLSIIAGGARFETLHYSVAFAGLSSKLLLLAAVGLMVPALFHFATQRQEYEISVGIAGILFAAYLANLAFTLVTHRQLFAPKQAEGPIETGRTAWGLGHALALLAIAALGLAVESETLTGALEPTSRRLGLSATFAGVFLLASVGNISEMINAILFARRGKMDLALAVTLGSSTQVALLVAPVVVFASLLLGHPMDLLFTQFEVMAIAIAVIVAQTMTSDGESHWIEGVMMVAVYAILGVGFFFLRGPVPGH
jgi:Ca2+:H+ antiporter